jgi:hypothetical protein
MSEVRQELPKDLELMAPGPELAVLLARVERRALSEKDRVRLAQARHRLVAHQEAQLLSDLYAMSWDETPVDEAEFDSAEASRFPWTEVEIAFALRWTRTAAGRQLERARQLAEDLPAVQQALLDGRIDMPKVLVICELASWLADVATARRLVDQVLDKAPELTTGQLRARLRKLVLAVDPDAACRRCAEAVRTRRVDSFANPDGSGELWGRDLPPQDTAAAWERLSAIARSAKNAGDSRTMDQLRADALLDLLVGEGVAVGDPLTRHAAGLPGADGPPFAEDPAATGPELPEPQQTEQAGQAGQGSDAGWDPAWPATPPPEQLGPHDVHPDPTGPPVDMRDEAGRAFDGPRLWPADWPGRWADDPAVAAADRRVPGPASCWRCGRPATPMPPPRRGTVDLLVPLTTLLGLAELPGELAGWGPVVADVARQVAEQYRNGTWRFSIYNDIDEMFCHGTTRARPDPDTGKRTKRRPAADVAALVKARNRTCTAPGCRMPATSCELDHTLAWTEDGESEPDNLDPKCTYHHRYKTLSGAEVLQLTPGVLAWTTPRGMQYVTRPDPPPWEDGDELVDPCLPDQGSGPSLTSL